MQSLSHLRSRSGSRDGVALIIVLAFIVLLTILVVSFIGFTKLNRGSTASYSSAVQAQEIAKGGLQDIISDLHAEILAGSIQDPNGSTFTQSGTTIYVPITNLTAVPARIGYVASNYNVTNATSSQVSTTLVRVSRASGNSGDTFYTQVLNHSLPYTNTAGLITNRASFGASTATPSANGRSISAARWNKTFLLATNSANIPSAFTTTPPDWVYVTRTGSRACTAAEVTAGTLKASHTLTTSYTAPSPGTAPAASPVIGRYAYVMYDESALLDANAVGSPSTLITGSPSAVVTSPSLPTYSNATNGVSYAFPGKSNLAFADLTQIPGFSSASAAQTKAAIDGFVDWRNAGSVASLGNSGANFLQIVFNYSKNGFLNFQTGDSPLLSRQDLINYFTNYDSLNGTTFSQCLPYLGTFSRAISAPTYTPPRNSQNDPNYLASVGTAIAYKDNAEQATPSPFSSSNPNPNRDLANIRFITGGTITHYLDNATTTNPDGTASKYTVNAGDPLLQNRFSLARIAWLSDKSIGGADPNGANPNGGVGNSGPSGAFATAIQSCFGLKWGVVGPIANGGNPCWQYVGSNGSFSGTIETLDQVATEKREPNFFELLKAAILSGSLGLSPGPAGWNNGVNGPFDFRSGEGGPGSVPYTIGIESLDGFSFDRNIYTVGQTPQIPAPAGIPDIQIIKIGADIIDQYDADSYPTAIYFPYPGLQSGGLNFDAASFTARAAGGTGDLSGPSDMVYGEENLPYLHAMFDVAGTTTSPTGSTGTATLQGWMQPQVWNPHQAPLTANLSAIQLNTIPNTYKIAGYGSGGFTWQNGAAAPNPTSGSSLVGDLDGSTITFVDSNMSSNPSASIFYPNPVPLTITLGSVSVTAQPGTGLVQADMIPTTSVGFSGNSLVGFYWGKDPAYYFDTTKTSLVRASEVTGMTFTLGWQDSSGGFHPYSYMPQLSGYSYSVLGPEKSDDERGSDDYHTSYSEETHVYTDPRTIRFSDLEGWGWWAPAKTLFYANGNFWGDNSGQGRPAATNFAYPSIPAVTSGYEIGWVANAVTPLTQTGLTGVDVNTGKAAIPSYYGDRDGVVRAGDGLWANASTGDGELMFITAGSPSGGGTYANGDSSINQHGRRPVVLNRPFRSVGELGYAFRDQPFKSLDFFTSSSADAGLLDVFSLTDESKVTAIDTNTSLLNSVVAGRFNPSNAPVPVLQAMLSGGSKKDLDPTYNIGSEGSSAPTVLTKLTVAFANTLNPPSPGVAQPLLNTAALVTQLSTAVQGVTTGGPPFFTKTLTSPFAASPDKGNKAYLESPVRALADVTNTRTWNLLIDIIAQAGQMSPAATDLNGFVVQGERRYWLHVAIDRYTGKIVSQQLEPVYE
jgi:Tfp pilus assembly protein PilX